MIDALNGWNFVTILILTFSLFLVITGAFTAYFGSGKSRKIGGGLLGGGLVLGIVWVILGSSSIGPKLIGVPSMLNVVIHSIVIIAAAAIGAVLAIGLFLLAIMKS